MNAIPTLKKSPITEQCGVFLRPQAIAELCAIPVQALFAHTQSALNYAFEAPPFVIR